MAEQESGSHVVSFWPQDNPSPYPGSNHDISVAERCHFGAPSDSQRALEPKSEVSREFTKTLSFTFTTNTESQSGS